MKASYSNGTMFALDVLDRMYKLNYYEELDSEKRTKCFASMESQRVERVRDLDWSCVAFNIIFFLSITAPIFLLASEPGYIIDAFKHPIIKYVMQVCMVIQVVCFIVFKRFTTLKV